MSAAAGSQVATTAIVLLLGPAASGLSVLDRLGGRLFSGRRGYRRFGISSLMIAAAAVECLLGIKMSTRIPAAERGPGAPLLVAGALALLSGWLALAAGLQRPRRAADSMLAQTAPLRPLGVSVPGRRASLRVWVWTAGVVAVASAAIGGLVISKVSVSPLVDQTTARAPLPLRQPGAVTGIGAGHMRWRVSIASGLAASVLVAGRYVVLVGGSGVTVLDAQTGRQCWHYRRGDSVVDAAAVTADGRFLVVRMLRYSDFPEDSQLGLIVGFSLATGQLRWQGGIGSAGVRLPIGLLKSSHQLSLVPFGDEMLMTCSVGAFSEFGGPACGSSATVFSAASGAPMREVKYCGPLGTAGGSAALAGAMAAGPGCYGNTIEILTVNGARHLWRPPHGGRLADFTQLPAPPIAPVANGFLIPFQQGPGNGQPGSWAVERVSTSGMQSTPVPIPCQDPRVVQLSGQALACASLAGTPSGWTVKAGGVNLAGRTSWLRQLTFPSQPYPSASGGILYLTTGPSSGPSRTLALRLRDGVLAGRACGFLIGSGPGLAVIAKPHGRLIALTAFN